MTFKAREFHFGIKLEITSIQSLLQVSVRLRVYYSGLFLQSAHNLIKHSLVLIIKALLLVLYLLLLLFQRSLLLISYLLILIINLCLEALSLFFQDGSKGFFHCSNVMSKSQLLCHAFSSHCGAPDDLGFDTNDIVILGYHSNRMKEDLEKNTDINNGG